MKKSTRERIYNDAQMNGIHSRYMYSVLDVRQIAAPGPGGKLVNYQLVRLKDPCSGSEEWKGACSDFDTEFWTKEVKEGFNKKNIMDDEAADQSDLLGQRFVHDWSNSSDGVFAMKVQDFMRHFNHLTICRKADDNRYFEQTYYSTFEPSYGPLSSKTQEWL